MKRLTNDEKKVNFFITRLKGHTTLWWDSVEEERKSQGNKKINRWYIIISYLRGKLYLKIIKFLGFRQMQNLKQKLMTVRKYTEELYTINMKVQYV